MTREMFPRMTRRSPIVRIVSGGQTGADRGALDAAIAMGVSHGGYCPRGRCAEDGEIPARYQLMETLSSSYGPRTAMNVIRSDGTLVVTRGRLTGGSALVRDVAVENGRPHLVVKLDGGTRHAEQVCEWLASSNVRVLNVAGPRESRVPGIGDAVFRLLLDVLGSGES